MKEISNPLELASWCWLEP